jgi:hypothetical protein
VGDNPLLERFREADGAGAARDECVEAFGFAVPTDAALDRIAAWAPNGVVEIGAGLGYWAHLLDRRGIDVVAYDLEPPPSAENPWHAGREPWFPIEAGGVERVAEHADRLLLVAWPTRNETWPADAIERYAANGGETVAYIGEPVGGATGDDRFHAMLGELTACLACGYGLVDLPCVCGVRREWEVVERVTLPSWDGCSDDLAFYRRAAEDGRRRRRWFRPRPGPRGSPGRRP